VFIFTHSFQLLFRDCNYPRGFMWWIGFHSIMFWFLFWEFYKNTYRAKQAHVKRKDEDNNKSSDSYQHTTNNTNTNNSKSSSFVNNICHLDFDQLNPSSKQTNGIIRQKRHSNQQQHSESSRS